MTPFEATLLSDSVSDLTRTLHGNRSLDLQERGLNQRDALAREELSQRRQDRVDLSAHRETMAQIQRESKELQDRHYKMMQSTGLLKTLQDGLKDGTIKPEALKGALADNPLLKDLGLGVDLFQAAPEVGSPEVWEDKASGRRFGYRKGSKEMHDLTPNMGSVTEEVDELTGTPKRKITRKLTPADLRSAMEEMQQAVGGEEPADMEQTLKDLESGAAIPAWGPAGGGTARPTAQGPAGGAPAEGGTVKVIAPDGTPGSIPRAQLQQALKEGYKLAQ